jgi:lipoyl(octanoyl) transferase
MQVQPIVIRHLGLRPYPLVYETMRSFTTERRPSTLDEIWFCEHPPVFTVGLHADPSHLLDPQQIQVIKTDRGGQVTYHGPGQLMVYFLLNLRQRKQGPAQLVCLIEKTILQLLKASNISAHLRTGMPGVYIDDAKVCALGLRIKKGCSYHGLALNVDMDLSPFTRIHPCGYSDLKVTQISNQLATPPTMPELVAQLEQYLLKALYSDLLHPCLRGATDHSQGSPYAFVSICSCKATQL